MIKQHLIAWLVASLAFACQPNESKEVATTRTGYPDIDNINQKLLDNPNDPTLYAARAALYYDYDGFDNAIKDLQKALSIDSTNVEYLHLLADVYLDYFKSRLALETMEKAAMLHPENILTLLKLSEFQLILTQHDAAMRTVDQILKKDPQNAEAYFMMGMTFKEKKDTARAINSFQQAVNFDSNLSDGWLQLGQLFAAMNKPIAKLYFENAVRVNPENVENQHALAFYLANTANDLEAALEVYKKINTIDPQYEEAYYNAGLIYLDLNDIDKAFEQFDLALKVSPTHIRSYFYRGVASEMKGNLATAKADYEQALRMAPDYEAARERLAQLPKK